MATGPAYPAVSALFLRMSATNRYLGGFRRRVSPFALSCVGGPANLARTATLDTHAGSDGPGLSAGRLNEIRAVVHTKIVYLANDV